MLYNRVHAPGCPFHVLHTGALRSLLCWRCASPGRSRLTEQLPGTVPVSPPPRGPPPARGYSSSAAAFHASHLITPLKAAPLFVVAAQTTAPDGRSSPRLLAVHARQRLSLLCRCRWRCTVIRHGRPPCCAQVLERRKYRRRNVRPASGSPGTPEEQGVCAHRGNASRTPAEGVALAPPLRTRCTAPGMLFMRQ